MNAEQSNALRAPFPSELISLLPKLSCYQCGQQREKVCDRHTKQKCQTCGAWISSGHIHLLYVGHAEVTDRFLNVDPEWTWEPMAFDGDGLPKLDHNGGLWMRLTLCGVTRPCYGDSQGKTGPNAVKEAIGDGFRNGGMRFGVALNLWAKSDLDAVNAEKETGDIVPSTSREHVDTTTGEVSRPAQQSRPARKAQPDDEVKVLKSAVWDLGQKLSMDGPALAKEFAVFTEGGELSKGTPFQLTAFADHLHRQLDGASA